MYAIASAVCRAIVRSGASRDDVPNTFPELTDNKQWQTELEELYGDVESVDLLTGTLAETKPPGFAISDTAFRIFIVMAGRGSKATAS